MSDQQQQKKSPMAMAGDVARAAELVNVATRSWSATFHTERAQPPKLTSAIDLAVDHEVQFFLDGTAKVLDLAVEVDVTGRERQGGGERVRMKASLVLRYKFEAGVPDVPQEYFKHFAELNGFMNAWPYVRELVQSMTARMSLPPLVLPLMKSSTLAKVPHKKKAG